MPRAPAPTGVTANLSSDATTKVEWNSVANVLHYEVQWRTVEEEWQSSGNVSATEYTARTPLCGNEYHFRVYGWGDGVVFRSTRGNGARAQETIPCAPSPFGHQADHNVSISQGSIAGTATGVESSITSSVTDWDSEIGSLGLGLNMCEGCSDSHTVTVKTVAGDPDSQDATHDFNTDCGTGYACVKIGNEDTYDGHLEDLAVVFEEPAYHEGTRIYWTNNSSLNNQPYTDPPGVVIGTWFHAKRIMIHELGHTLGIADLNGTDISGVMNNPHTWPDIMTGDLDYLRRIYGEHATH